MVVRSYTTSRTRTAFPHPFAQSFTIAVISYETNRALILSQSAGNMECPRTHRYFSQPSVVVAMAILCWIAIARSEEHTSELQSPCNLVCRLLLEKKKNIILRECATILQVNR